jgi:hypothetical protein
LSAVCLVLMGLSEESPERVARVHVRAGAEEEDHPTHTLLAATLLRSRDVEEVIHKRVRKPHLGAVHDAIPDAFHERKNIVVFRIQYDLLSRRLLFDQLNARQKAHRKLAYLKRLQSVHGCYDS